MTRNGNARFPPWLSCNLHDSAQLASGGGLRETRVRRETICDSVSI